MRKTGYRFTSLAAAIGLLALAPGDRAMAGPWDMDTTYGDAGLVTYDVDGEVQARALPDGTLLEATVTPAGILLRHRDVNGRADSSFGVDGKIQVNFPAGFSNYDAFPYLDPEGRLLWCGSMDTNNDGIRDGTILRYTTHAIPDLTFGSRGIVSQAAAPFPLPNTGGAGESCDSLAIQPDGLIVEAIARRDATSVAKSLVRLNPDGTTDPAFGAGKGAASIPASPYDEGKDIQVLPNGWITVSNGGRDFTFDADGSERPGPRDNADLPAQSYVYDDPVEWQVLGIPGTGDMLLVGNDNGKRLLIARENADGSMDRRFAGAGYILLDRNTPAGASYSFVTASLSQDGQRLYIVRRDFNLLFGEPGGGEILRLIASGTRAGQLDTDFGVGGRIPWPFPRFELSEQSRGSVVLNGPGGALRLSETSGPSPGIVGFTNGGFGTGSENAGFTVRVVRVAGHDGVATVAYKTAESSNSGKAGVNYESASGLLRWADGDAGDQQITLKLQKGASDLLPSFFLRLDHPQGAKLFDDEMVVGVKGTAPSSSAVAPSATTDNYRQVTSGGGSTDLLSLLLLLLGGGAALRARVGNRTN